MTLITRTTRTQKQSYRLSWGAAGQCAMPHCQNTELYNWNIHLKLDRFNNGIDSSNTPALPHQLLVCMSLRILITTIAAITYGIYITNWVQGPKPRPSGRNTSSNPPVSAFITRPAFNGMERICQHHGGNWNSHPPVLVQKPLCKQFIHYHQISRGFFL